MTARDVLPPDVGVKHTVQPMGIHKQVNNSVIPLLGTGRWGPIRMLHKTGAISGSTKWALVQQKLKEKNSPVVYL